MPDTGMNLPKTLAVLRQGVSAGQHLGAQLYVSRPGRVVADLALGEARAGVPLRRDTLLPWLSAGKPLTAVAIAQLWEKGALDLDDRVRRHLPEFAQAGKDAITLRHLLTHTAGFRGADQISDALGWEETLAAICATPLEAGWTPGAKAGYQTHSSWFVLGEIIRRVDGRPLERYARENIFEPLAMVDSWIGMSAETASRYAARLGALHDTAGGAKPGGTIEPARPGCRPGSGACGPVRELGRFYETLLLGRTTRVASPHLTLQARTIDALTARQRIGLFDHTFQHTVDWGLGFLINSNRHGADTTPYGYGRHCSEDTFGHSGAQSSCAFADPARQLVVAWVCNGRPGERLHQHRTRAINTAIYEDLRLAPVQLD